MEDLLDFGELHLARDELIDDGRRGVADVQDRDPRPEVDQPVAVGVLRILYRKPSAGVDARVASDDRSLNAAL